MVHAGIPPQWSVEDAIDRAREVEKVLQSPDCIEFLGSMYGNEPLLWSDDLTGMTRLRVITNYLTRMRFCTSQGVLDLDSKGPSPDLGKLEVSAWFSHPERKTAKDRILFGHWASIEGQTDHPNAIGLDTGCVWGGAMSLYQLETGRWTRCQCKDGRSKRKLCEQSAVTTSPAAAVMEIYLVGGAVRDALLGYPSSERDWVVVGASPQDMLEQGYQQVGKDFPVFLHPQTKEEYALARTERKQGHGYTGFAVHCDPAVTLEEDLLRRDLTINAMARRSPAPSSIPMAASADLAAKVLRHVSDAFVEDPLRVLRTARFAARYAHLGFTVAAETIELMARDRRSGRAGAPAGRAGVGGTRARPGGAQPRGVYRGAARLRRPAAPAAGTGGPVRRAPNRRIPPRDRYRHPHPDGPAAGGRAVTPATDVRFAVLIHDLGKGATPPAEWPRHIAHEQRGLKLVERSASA